MSIQIENIKYRLPDGNYYIGTTNMDKNGSGFLIREDYFDSAEFKTDFLVNIVKNYPYQLVEFIMLKETLDNSLNSFNRFLSHINGEVFMMSLHEDMSICMIDPDKLEKFVDSGVFTDIDCRFNKIINVRTH